MKNLKIYFTSDVHGYIFPTDYRDRDYKNMGFLNIINSFKRDANTIIIDGGDTIQGSPFATYIRKQELSKHPYSSVINSGSYDYIVLGNHDFNYGYDYLMSYLHNINAKVITANVIDKVNSNTILPYDIKTLENGLKVGIIGVTTDFINVWEQKCNLINFEIHNTYSTLQKYFDEVKSQSDIIIGVYHGGFENDLETKAKLSDTTENIAFRICEDFDFDVLLTGHQHMELIDRFINNTYIAQTPGNGVKYVEINVEYDHDKITNISGVLKVPEINKNIEVSAELMGLEKSVQEWLDQPVGYLNTELKPNTHIQMAMNGSLLTNFINQIQLEVSNADIACAALANSVKGFDKEVSVRDIVSTYIYPNTLVVKEVTGEILKLALEKCGSYFHNNNGNITVSELFLKPKIEHYNYDYYANIEYTFDLSKDIGSRVVSIKYKDEEVKYDDILKLVMNNYRSSGTGGYGFFKDLKVVEDIQIDMTELIINYFMKYKHVVVDERRYITIKK